MSDLLRSLIVAGLISGTQPVTVMGLLVLRTGNNGVRNSSMFLLGAFTVETVILVAASLFAGGVIDRDTTPGTVFLGLRVVLGLAFVVAGLRLRRPPKKESPEIPKALQRLRDLTPAKSFVAGVLLADYVGPVLASLAIMSSDVGAAGRVVSALVFTALATGIPGTFLLLSVRSRRTGERLEGGMHWVMQHRRQLASWIALILGALLIADGLIGLVIVD